MAEWKFDTRPEHLLEQDLTQRDQFNNDDVDLAEALVREVIQNSTDAALGDDPVKVTFRITVLDGSDAEEFRELVRVLVPHLEASGVDSSIIDERSNMLLKVEDFNTKGLTGDYMQYADGNFYNFWKRHGRSNKSGNTGGRWGLGKLVYSSSSQIHSFFGLTVQNGSDTPLLMGQSVLTNHEIGEDRFYWYGYYANRDEKQFQLPETDLEEISRFCRLTGLTRSTQPGLSVLVPYLYEDITHNDLLRNVLKNYHFPILSGSLVVEVDDRVIDAEHFDEAVRAVEGAGLGPVDFVKAVDQKKKTDTADFTGVVPITTEELSETYFDVEELSKLRELYACGAMVHIVLPVELQKKSGENFRSSIDVFLQKLPQDAEPYALFVRGSITVPSEARWFTGQAYGAMIATDEAVVSFLGDAENPAHTAWNERAEKLAVRWVCPSKALRAIRKALAHLYTAIGQEEESRDPDVLLDFFSLVDTTRSSGGKKKRTPVPKPDPASKKKDIHIYSRKGGFSLAPGPAAEEWVLPKLIQVQMAYDMLGADPFKRHSLFDFDLTKSEIRITEVGGAVEATGPNLLQIRIDKTDFKFTVEGFDKNRDLVVKART